MADQTQPTDSADKERQMFEAVLIRTGWEIAGAARLGDGYANRSIDHMWAGWQSRAALDPRPSEQETSRG